MCAEFIISFAKHAYFSSKLSHVITSSSGSTWQVRKRISTPRLFSITHGLSKLRMGVDIGAHLADAVHLYHKG